MFNMSNTGYSNQNKLSVNTQLYRSYSDTCQLTLGAWNDNLSIKFAPFKGVNGDGYRTYAEDRSEVISTSLTVDNAITLTEGAKETIIPALKEKKASEVSVTMGSGDNRKVLKLTTDGEKVSISIYLGVNEQGVATGDHITHTFNTREYMTSYDPTTGNNTSVTVNSDFENFITKVSNIQDLSMAVPHTIKYSNAVKNEYAKKQGGYNNSGYGNNSSSYGGNNSSYQAPQTTNYSSMDDFLPMN